MPRARGKSHRGGGGAVHSAGGTPASSVEQWGWAGLRDGGRDSRKALCKDWASDPRLREIGEALGGCEGWNRKECPG